MTSERQKCGLSSLFPMSCRGRAEAFARRLHSRLRSLGSHEENGSADESSWLAAHENSIALSQPRHSSDGDLYLDFGLLESPGSPEEELNESELHRLINKDHLKQSRSEECHCPKLKEKKEKLSTNLRSASNDSDSDGPFYDTSENDNEHRTANGINGDTNSESSKSLDSETGICVSSEDTNSKEEESYATTSDCTPQPCSSLSEDVSTLSLKDSDCPSLEASESFTEFPKSDSEVTGADYSKCNEVSEENGGNHIGEANEVLCLVEETETYISCLSVDKDLIVECPRTVETASQTQILDAQVAKEEDDDSEEEERIPRVRRCSSLKSGKTPPDTPGRKKIVRFADALGLDLADVRTFLDEIPKVPNSAYEDLKDVDLGEASSVPNMMNSMTHGVKAEKILMPLFQQPVGQPNFLDLVRDNQVCLENAFVEDPLMLSIKGTVRVRNLDFHKSVYIRYTLDSWKTFADVQAVYVENSCDGFSDKFTFLIYAHTLSVGQRIEFACRFQCKGCQYWDSNKGANYCFQCLPASHNAPATPITGVDEWGASFY
ncbi:glycogen-binding subunit 76A isoform X2 [Anoplophora glabripennis]|nr:glycogen-binding subunit 76A isoform X2 [Anoplophora glabripennis]